MSEKYENKNQIIDGEILDIAADMIHTEIEMDIIDHEKRCVCIPKDLNSKILEIVCEKDAQLAANRRITRIKRFNKIAAIFIICFVATGLVAIDKSDALKHDIMNFIYDQGFVKIENDVESQVMSTWKEFWYPSYVPGDLILKSSDEKHHLLQYLADDSNRELRIDEFSLDTCFTLDSEATVLHDLKLDEKDSIYYEKKSNEISGIIIKTNDRYVAVECSGNWTQSEIIKVAKGLVYIQNKNIK